QAFDLSAARRHENYAITFDGVFRVPADGTYTFTLSSDDGSNLYVDGALVVDNDGVHAPATIADSVKLTKGLHKITVAFFQGGGGDELAVEIEGPGLARQPLGSLVAATEQELDKSFQKAPVLKVDDDDFFEVKPEW